VFADLRTRVFADGADLASILELAKNPRISGFTTNPTLMKQAGVTDYERFAREVLEHVHQQPISFEVFADDPAEMKRQALRIAAWAENVYVKIPISTTSGESLDELIRDLSESGVKVNVTAMFTVDQVRRTTKAVLNGAACYLSVFAGRIADAGIDPMPIMRESIEVMAEAPLAECIWASPREVLNLVQANEVGCHIITMTPDLLKKIDGLGKDLNQFSLETVQMFFRDAQAAGFEL
jgi:transaldolase